MAEIATFPGFTLPDKGFIKLPNNWTDITAEIDNLAELKIIMYILRHTWGYQEYSQLKHITIDEFVNGRKHNDGTRMDKGAGLGETCVKQGLARAIEHGYVICEIDDSDKGRIRKYYGLKLEGRIATPDSREPTPDSRNATMPSRKPTRKGTDTDPRTERETLDRYSEKDTKEKESTPSLPSALIPIENLSDLERAFWDLWCSLDDIKPVLNQTAYGHVKELAPLVTTIETLKSLLDYTQKKIDANERITDKTVHLGNLKNCYKGWKRIYKPAQKSIKEMSKDELIAYALSFPLRLDHHSEEYKLYHNCIDRLPPDDKKAVVKQRFEAQNKTVLWTRYPDSPDFKIDPSVWYLFEDMPLSEAQKYNYDLFGGVPGDTQTRIRTNYDREARGELKRPVLV